MQNIRTNLLFPIALIILEIAIFLSNDMYLPTMPTIAQDLGLNQQQIQHTLTFWFLGSGSLQLFLGPISDRFGRRVILLCGGVVYIISSYVCGIAQTLPLLLAARFVQGSTVCAVLVAGGAAVHEKFPTKMAIKIFSFINAVTILAPAFGPLFGALIVEFASWRDIFFILTGLGVLGTILNFIFMPETNHAKHTMNFKKIFHNYKSLIFNKGYMFPNISYCLLFSISFLWMFEAPFLMIESYGVSNMYYGVSQTLIFGCFFIGAELTRFVLNRRTLKYLLNFALIITVIGTLALVLVAKFFDSMPGCIACLMFISIGTSMLFAPLNRIGIESSTVPMGSRIAIYSTMISLFGAGSGWLVSLITIHSLINISVMILGCVVLVMLFLLNTKVPVLLNEDEN